MVLHRPIEFTPFIGQVTVTRDQVAMSSIHEKAIFHQLKLPPHHKDMLSSEFWDVLWPPMPLGAVLSYRPA
jgi:hypothetical protein